MSQSLPPQPGQPSPGPASQPVSQLHNSPPQPAPLPPATTKKEKKTGWDWLQVVIIPVTLVFLAGILGGGQAILSFQLSDAQHTNDVNLAADQQRETELKGYLDTMSTLLGNPDLRDPAKGVDLRSLARAQTLTILRELGQDGVRKAVVVHFLHDAGLFVRDPFPIVSLAGADLSWAELRNIDLGGADLAGANLTRADLTDAYLIGADLSQVKLNGANLTRAKLDYTPLIGADLSCADLNGPRICTNLTGADLGGADFTGANLGGVNFQQTDISGTNPQDLFTRPLKNGSAFTAPWKVIWEDNNTLLIAYNEGSLLPPYGRLDLTTSKLQLSYGPLGNWGTSVVLLPALWSRTSCPTDYCEAAPITGYSFPQRDLVQDTFPISVSGTIAGLSVKARLTFSKPTANSISVAISTQASSAAPVELDQIAFGAKLQNEAFKPVLLRAMHDSPSQWTAQEDVFENQLPSQLPENTRTPPANISTFGLIGGTSNSVTNAPNITVTLNNLKSAGNDLNAAVTVEVKPGNDLSVDNVSMWAGVDSLPDEWSYTVVASMPSEEYTQITSRSPALYDSLNNNKAGNSWDENADCRFAQGAYHVDGSRFAITTPPQGDSSYTVCTAQTPNFSNFAYQIWMKFVDPGCAGIIFRAYLLNNNYDYDIFTICPDGSYSYSIPDLYIDTSICRCEMSFSTKAGGTSSTLRKQVSQGNTITITTLAIGKSIRFFINQQYVMAVDDQSGSSQGQIGVIVFDRSSGVLLFHQSSLPDRYPVRRKRLNEPALHTYPQIKLGVCATPVNDIGKLRQCSNFNKYSIPFPGKYHHSRDIPPDSYHSRNIRPDSHDEHLECQ